VKNNGDVITFFRQKDYVMLNNTLGSGSFSKTVLLKDSFIDELFVAKKYEPENNGDKALFYKNFLDEIKIMYKLNHKNLVRIYNYYAFEEFYTGYILMEYIDGKDIGSYMSNYVEPFAIVSLDDIFVQLIDAFRYIEEHNIIHRDIREGNILIDNKGIVKIIDFGIGKIFRKLENYTDSLKNEINRANSDALPSEYYNGIYTSKTDQYYLAELFNRLMRESEKIDNSDFSYQRILEKMMQKNPINRYSSFAEIREMIGKFDFSNMPISESDKITYQDFANVVFKSLSSFADERRFNYDVQLFVEKLEKTLSNNLFEDVIQNNSDVISSIVNGAYRYTSSISIKCKVVKEFVNWFKNSTEQSKKLILGNLISKLSTIGIENKYDIPF
jgi:serine/threonine-protein kinase